MEKRTTRNLAVFSAFLWFSSWTGLGVVAPSVAGQSHAPAEVGVPVDCDREPLGALQRGIDRARPGDTVRVRGTCNENVTIPEGKDQVVLDGSGGATVNGPDSLSNTITVRGRGTTITGFTITGGRAGVDVGRGASAVIDANTIDGTARFGVIVHGAGSATIVDNTIQNSSGHGILVTASSFAFIGIRGTEDTVASPNIIRNNGLNGVGLLFSSSARIVGNTISDNLRNGVNVAQASQANISDNAIDANGLNGVFVTENSGVNLGSDTGVGIFDAPNTTSANNGVRGISCRVGGYANGQLGTLNGNSGPKNFGTSCIDSLDVADTF